MNADQEISIVFLALSILSYSVKILNSSVSTDDILKSYRKTTQPFSTSFKEKLEFIADISSSDSKIHFSLGN